MRHVRPRSSGAQACTVLHSSRGLVCERLCLVLPQRFDDKILHEPTVGTRHLSAASSNHCPLQTPAGDQVIIISDDSEVPRGPSLPPCLCSAAPAQQPATRALCHFVCRAFSPQ
ncbi:hypothetical protein N658DRAFT_188865 [Parathielavia hyrcaniae]|uniref:Uncharacterized protein n=1 Tax=Parathielavia hyrcaniae TaxID=113614 RepID=A0AAN6Q9P5_9PEZI|nr:hypothetical protein N658DRAFT_188865 [Parathielavia hyrcaniae]